MSTIFENLILLPDNIFWQILRMSCSYNKILPRTAGKLLDYNFWPHWNSNNTKNKRYVEPDMFIRFEEFDIIVEAKYSDEEGQNNEEWERELKAYYNEYNENKRVYLIALGGSVNMKNEVFEIYNIKCSVIKCNWLSILSVVTQYKEELVHKKFNDYNNNAQIRILDNIILGFSLNNMSNFKWFSSLNDEEFSISENSIYDIQYYYLKNMISYIPYFNNINSIEIKDESIKILKQYGK